MARSFLNGNAEAGPLTVTQPVTTTGAPVLETLTGAANTGLTAATEVNDIYWNLSRTLTWATTVPATQRAVYINASSLVYAAGSATQTITTAATLAINGAPAGSTNVTITTPLALWVESGNSLFAGKVTSTGAAVLDTGANGSSFGGALTVGTNLTVTNGFFSQTYGSSATTATNAAYVNITASGALSSATFAGENSTLTVNIGSAATTAIYAASISYVNTFNASLGGVANAFLSTSTLQAGSFQSTFYIVNTTTGTNLANLVGVNVVPSVVATASSGTGTITNVYGVQVAPGAFSAISAGTTIVTNYYGLYLGTVTVTGAGTTTITNRYGIYQADSAATNYFAGVITQTFTSAITTALSADLTTATFTGASGSVLQSGMQSSVAATPGGASTATYIGVYSTPSVTSQANANAAGAQVIGFYSSPSFTTANISGVTVLASVCGLYTNPSVGSTNASGTNTVTNVYGVEVAPGTWTASGGGGLTVTNYYGIYLATVTLTTTTITNRYGIYQQDPAAINTFFGKVNFPASTTGFAPVNLGQGLAPTSPVNGDEWITNTGLYAQVAGVTQGPFTTVTRGQTTVNFGSFPGSSMATVAITGQTGILTTSIVQAWLYPVATTDHSVDEHTMETISVTANSIVGGTGFTITAVNNSTTPEGNDSGTLLYGQYTVAWMWM